MDTDRLPGCYRHPDRDTGISCTRCERPICPECMISASVGFQCPECVREGSGTGHRPTANAPRTLAGGVVAADPHLVTKILIGINVLVFLVGAINPALVVQLELIARYREFAYLVGPIEGVSTGEYHRLLTSVFLHTELWHIAGNMIALWVIGGPLEAALGRARYLAVYLLSGLGGSALVYLMSAPNTPTLGASGAVFGLLGATVVLVHAAAVRDAAGHRHGRADAGADLRSARRHQRVVAGPRGRAGDRRPGGAGHAHAHHGQDAHTRPVGDLCGGVPAGHGPCPAPYGGTHLITPASTLHRVIHRSSVFSSGVDDAVDNSWGELPSEAGRCYFHCVDTPNPAAMKPKPTTMFQLPSASIGSWVSVT